MKTDYLVLPFRKGITETSLYGRGLYNVAPNVDFRIYTKPNELIPFVFPLDVAGNSFELEVIDFYGTVIGKVTEKTINHVIVSDGLNNRSVVFFGGKVPCLDLWDCTVPYCIRRGNWHSEWFWSSSSNELLKCCFGNKVDFLTVPYSLGFKQWFWIDTKFGTSDIDTYTVASTDERGFKTVKYQTLTESFNLYLNSVPAHLKQVFASIEGLDYVEISNTEQTILCTNKQGKIKPKRAEQSNELFDLEVTIPSDRITEINLCGDANFSKVKSVEIDEKYVVCEDNRIEYDVDCDGSDVFFAVAVQTY